jgi:hypothetical protein
MEKKKRQEGTELEVQYKQKEEKGREKKDLRNEREEFEMRKKGDLKAKSTAQHTEKKPTESEKRENQKEKDRQEKESEQNAEVPFDGEVLPTEHNPQKERKRMTEVGIDCKPILHSDETANTIVTASITPKTISTIARVEPHSSNQVVERKDEKEKTVKSDSSSEPRKEKTNTTVAPLQPDPPSTAFPTQALVDLVYNDNNNRKTHERTRAAIDESVFRMHRSPHHNIPESKSHVASENNNNNNKIRVESAVKYQSKEARGTGKGSNAKSAE